MKVSAYLIACFASQSLALTITDRTAAIKAIMQAAAVATCPDVIENRSFNCGARCGGQLSGSKLIVGFKSSTTDQAGYIAVSSALNAIIVSFRGTATTTGTIIDTQITPSTPNFVSSGFISMVKDIFAGGAKIHSGFEKSYTSVRDLVQSNLKKAASDYPTYDIIFTGHSLGGAVANLAAFDFSNLNNKVFDSRVSVYTYGQPRVGNDAYVQLYQKYSFASRYYRVMQEADPIPQLPFLNLGYQHVGKPFQIKSTGSFIECPISGPGQESSQCYTPTTSQNLQNHSRKIGYFQVGLMTCNGDKTVF